MQEVDYIIVGQGLAGSCVAIELLNRNKRFVVFDVVSPNSASRIAAGLFNPITGRTNQPTWRAREIFEKLFSFYHLAERLTQTQFLYTLPIYRPFLSGSEQGKYPSESKEWIIEEFKSAQYPEFLYDSFGGILTHKSGYIDTIVFLESVRNLIRERAGRIETSFDYKELTLTDKVRYQGYVANKIIFCEGCYATHNPWFNWLPLRKLKGELLTVRANLPRGVIINRGIFSVPFRTNEFILGSTYVHDETDGNTVQGLESILLRASKLFNANIEIIDESWGHRPTTPDRRPILGSHPIQKNICIFNGLGTKGVSLTPFFAVQLIDWLEGISDLDRQVNIERYYSLSFKLK